MSATEPGPVDVVPSEPSAPSQSPLEIWRAFDLNGRRSQLDKQGLDIADRQESSATARKSLTISTRSFKASMSTGPISKKDVGLLLKAYQTEVDSLTTRAKAAESSFLSLYKALYDAPDPVDELLRASKDAALVTDLREELLVLKNERSVWAERIAASSGLEKRIEELESQLVAANDRSADDARVKMEEKQAQWMSAQQTAIEAYEMREQELLHQIRLSNDNARRMQANYDDMQRQHNQATTQLQAMKDTRANVSEMAAEDLERTRAEAKSLRRRCADLEMKLDAQNADDSSLGATDSVTAVGRSTLSAELAAREVEVSQLKDQVTALEEVLGGKDQEKRNQFAKLTNSITGKDEELGKLRKLLEELPTLEEYETLSRQFETLQSYQLLENEKDALEATAKSEGVSGEGGPQRMADTLEKRLLNKMKSLEGRITKMRVDIGEKDSKISELIAQVHTFEEQSMDQKALISKLEEGINAITGDHASVHNLKRRAVAASKGESESGKVTDMQYGENDQTESTWDWGEQHQAEGLENIIREEPSMLDIVAGQRDRFRARTLELEEDTKKLMERIEKLNCDLDSLKSDNVQLYEKIRFLQSYRQSNGSVGSNLGGSVVVEPGHGINDDDENASFLGKYRSLYEDMVNPYTIFNRRERYKRMSEMSAPERITLRASQRALSTRTSRLIVFFYILALHVLVALVLGFSASNFCLTEVTTKAQH